MEKSSVLIADDDTNIREMYAIAFTQAGITVIQATNGQECVELALKHHPGAILVDIMMPVLNGHEAIAKIRLDPWGKKANVVYLTNMSDAENVFHAVEHGTDAYIVKANTSVKEVVNKVRLAMQTR